MLLGAKLIQFFETPKFFVTILWTHNTFLRLRVRHIVDFIFLSHLLFTCTKSFYNLLFSALPAPVPLYFERAGLKL